jgi:hypothetical protein
MRSIAEGLVGGSAAAAKSDFFSRLNFIAAGVEKSDFPCDQVWTFGQNLNGWI